MYSLRAFVLAVCGVAGILDITATHVGWYDRFVTFSPPCHSGSACQHGDNLVTYGLQAFTACDHKRGPPLQLTGCASTSYVSLSTLRDFSHATAKTLATDPLVRAHRGLRRATSLFTCGLLCCVVCAAVVIAAPLRLRWLPTLPAVAPAVAALITTAVGCATADGEMRELQYAHTDAQSKGWERTYEAVSGSGKAGLVIGIAAAPAGMALRRVQLGAAKRTCRLSPY